MSRAVLPSEIRHTGTERGQTRHRAFVAQTSEGVQDADLRSKGALRNAARAGGTGGHCVRADTDALLLPLPLPLLRGPSTAHTS